MAFGQKVELLFYILFTEIVPNFLMISGYPFFMLLLWGKSATPIFFARENTRDGPNLGLYFDGQNIYFSKPNILAQVTKAMANFGSDYGFCLSWAHWAQL